jgi:hypothetical protein
MDLPRINFRILLNRQEKTLMSRPAGRPYPDDRILATLVPGLIHIMRGYAERELNTGRDLAR